MTKTLGVPSSPTEVKMRQGSAKLPKTIILEESPRPLLPILLCLITFATVLSVLIIYMDTTEIRHQQFRLNMTRDYELQGISQDDPQLITYVRDIYLRRYSKDPITPHQHVPWDYHNRKELTPRMAKYVVEDLLGGKRRGVFVQSMTGANERLITARWLSAGAQWTGILVEPELRKYFEYRKEMAGQGGRVEVVHACISPNEYPKEVDWRVEGDQGGKSAKDDVRVDSLLGDNGDGSDNEVRILNDDDDLEAGRVKCFSLFTILLATNRTNVDLLSLGCRGHHLQILQTLPFDRVHIRVISLHFGNPGEDSPAVVGNITRFLYGKGFEFVRRMEENYFYQAIARDPVAERKQEQVVEQREN